MQGGDFSFLTQLQELHISTGDDVVVFQLLPNGLPTSLRRLRVHHGRKPPYTFPKLVIVPPPFIVSEGKFLPLDGAEYRGY